MPHAVVIDEAFQDKVDLCGGLGSVDDGLNCINGTEWMVGEKKIVITP